jgi:type II secretory ATPase GspE/PulE/Tfp pilus assembly ATPase PilB-like protein/GAF domain-containing protein
MASTVGTATFRSRMVDVVNKIHAAPSTRDILIGLKDEIQSLINAERLTIFALDTQNQQLYSITAIGPGGEPKEIRVPKSFTSIAGFTALSRQTLNIKDAYDPAELGRLHPKLTFDQRWDKQTNFRTKQVLSVPITFDKFLLGVVQAVNRKGGGSFSAEEVAGLEEVAKTLGIAFYNQRRATRATKPTRYGHLLDKGVVSEQDLDTAAADARVKNCSVDQVLLEKFKVPKPDLLASLGQFYNLPVFEFTGAESIPEDVKDRLNVDFLKKNHWAPVARKGPVLVIAMVDPQDLTKVDAIKTTNLAPRYEIQVGIAEDIRKLVEKTYGAEKDAVDTMLGEIDTDELVIESTDEENEGGVDEEDSEVVKLANVIIRDAYRMGASDIHVEPYGDKANTVIRFRTDGDCQVYKELPPQFRNALVSRFKIMARLDISERRKPQDGKIRFRSKSGTIELRVATIPTSGGNEDVVMRILAGSEPLPLDKMGFSERNLREFKALLEKPYGICLVVGPTGSGKTTTLHSGLGFINKPDLKIWTAEDPVEITQKGLRQVQVMPKIGFTFAQAMRAFLRADPDVIMVGEMRDRETAQTGIEASLTGHIVFSTLHTNSAAETITRLLDMEIDPFSFADALLGILAQRLVRTLCKTCKVSYHPDREEFDEMVESYGGADAFARTGIRWADDLVLYKAKGCSECADSGFRGRMAIHELLVTNPVIKDMIIRKAPVAEIHAQAVADGMETLMQDGIVKVFKGLTTFPQIRMVCMR